MRPLIGGFDAWKNAGFRVEPKTHRTQTAAEVAENLRQAEGDQDLPAS